VEEKLSKSEEKYRSIFENVQDVYYEAALDGTIIEVSPSIEIISKGQYHRDDLIGKSMYEFYYDAGERQALLKALQERGSVTDFEVTLKNRDGSLIPCSISSKILFNAQGNPEKITGSMRDITKRNRAEQELRESKALVDAVVENVPLMISIKEATDLRFVIFNRAGEELLHGIARQEQSGSFSSRTGGPFHGQGPGSARWRSGHAGHPGRTYPDGQEWPATASYSKGLHKRGRWDHEIPVGHFRGHHRAKAG
jgi:PAS domain S-box-containing protein